MLISPCGYLSIRVGPMRSGKTDFLRSSSTRFADIGEKVIYINSSKDKSEDRNTEGGDGNNYTSHSSSSNKFSDKVDMVKCSLLSEVDVLDYDVICIDEAQFFEDLYETVLSWYLDLNKHILISSLDGSYKQNVIGEVYKLIPHAQEFVKLLAICQLCINENKHKECSVKIKHNDASYNIWIGEDLNISSEIKPGFTDCFVSVCTYHYKLSKK